MSLGTDLLEQARHLVSRERRKPKQASLRRAISSSYYALFHTLIEEAARLVLPANQSSGARSRVGRTFGHAEMKKVSQAFATPSAKPSSAIEKLVAAAPPIPTDMITVANAFIELQEARHEADYNTARHYTRQEARTFVQTADAAIQSLRRVRTDPVARTYLVALLIWKKWDRL